jgi:hypothetical protein
MTVPADRIVWERVRRLTFVPFLHDGRCALVPAGGRLVLPSGEVLEGEDPMLDTGLRVPRVTAGFAARGFTPSPSKVTRCTCGARATTATAGPGPTPRSSSGWDRPPRRPAACAPPATSTRPRSWRPPTGPAGPFPRRLSTATVSSCWRRGTCGTGPRGAGPGSGARPPTAGVGGPVLGGQRAGLDRPRRPPLRLRPHPARPGPGGSAGADGRPPAGAPGRPGRAAAGLQLRAGAGPRPPRRPGAGAPRLPGGRRPHPAQSPGSAVPPTAWIRRDPEPPT